VARNRERNAGEPGREPGKSCIPKKEGAINPINSRGELALLSLWQKIKHYSPNSCLFEGVFSGMDRVLCFLFTCIFFVFLSAFFFSVAVSNQPIKLY
jgi:hypothetical protein